MSAKGYLTSSGLALVCLFLASASAMSQQVADPTRNLTPVTDDMLRNPPAADWLMWRRTYDGYGYSPLDQINKSNVEGPSGCLDLVDGARRDGDDSDRSRRRALSVQLRQQEFRRSMPQLEI